MNIRKFFAQALAILLLVFIAMFCWIPRANAAAVWDIDIHASSPFETFELKGYMVTSGTDLTNGQLIRSFAGTFSDIYELDQHVSLVPLGRTVAAGFGQIFVYDNLLFSTNVQDAFDINGLLLNAGLSNFNLYSGTGYDDHNGLLYTTAIEGTITFDKLASTVPEVSNWFLMIFGVFQLWAVFVILRSCRKQ